MSDDIVAAPASDPSFTRFEVRGATRADERALAQLAAHLNTVNLPDDRDAVRELLVEAERSFEGSLPQERRKLVFLLWDRERQVAVGTSTLIAQLGRRDAPYIYFDVLDEERYSRSLDKHFHHVLLRLGFSYDGPTELGGLVVDPAYRRSPERLGRFVSYSRLAYVAAHREGFRDQLLAELLPPLESDGTSHLWEALGRRFTELSYQEADRLSSRDKEFIRDLFPRGVINLSLLPPEARAVVGQVGAQTRGVERMLGQIGFRYARRVDPFDGGPHFVAATDEVGPVRGTRELTFFGAMDDGPGRLPSPAGAPTSGVSGEPLPLRGIVTRDLEGPPHVIMLQSAYQLDESGLRLPAAVAEHLSLEAGEGVWLTPLPPPRSSEG
jgi:arginine N-succinyltransferase